MGDPTSNPLTDMSTTEVRSLDELGMDGKLWAEEFHATAKRLGYPEMDEGWLIGWFCNAIMAGFDEARRRYDPETRALTAQGAAPSQGLARRVYDLASKQEFARDAETLHQAANALAAPSQGEPTRELPDDDRMCSLCHKPESAHDRIYSHCFNVAEPASAPSEGPCQSCGRAAPNIYACYDCLVTYRNLHRAPAPERTTGRHSDSCNDPYCPICFG